MNETLKSIITNPFVIGGTAIGTGVITAAVIYGKRRPKTEAEIELEKLKERNAEADREREHVRSLEQIRAKQAADAIESEERTKRMAKEQEEKTKRLNEELAEARAKREFEKTAPDGYWRVKEAEARAAGEKAAAVKEAETQKEIARLQADAARYSAEANARANERRDMYAYKRQESADAAEIAKTQALYGGMASIASAITGKPS